MLRRGALVLFLIVGLGIAAILAAGSFGITWPWQQTANAPAVPGSEAPAGKSTSAAQSPTDPSGSPDAQQAAKTIEETTAALSPAQPAEAPKQGSVALDISRISPDGPSVFAGRAEPDSYVTILENGKPAGTVQADANGDWSLSTEHRFASTDPKLTFEASATPPAAPTPPPAAEAPKVAEKPAEPAQRSAAMVANDVMKKFEDLVAKAREEAKAEQQAKAEQNAKTEETAKTENKTQTEEATKAAPEADAQQQAASPTPESTPAPLTKAEPPAQGADSASSATERATANAGSSAGASASTTTGSRESDTSPQEKTAAAEPAMTPGSQTGKTEAIPVPIMFVYNEATLTPDGQRAANLLLEYLTLKHLSAVELTGHADERGTSEYNMDLSRDRLATVSDLLKNGGYSGELKLTPKGKSEPFMGVDRAHFSGEALYQLDRRVELRVAR
jgi:outer membrane protein OmpA-like peptidoglycan-associated protein